MAGARRRAASHRHRSERMSSPSCIRFSGGRKKRGFSSATSQTSAISSTMPSPLRPAPGLRPLANGCRTGPARFPASGIPTSGWTKGFAKTLAYEFLANEERGVAERREARGSTQWGRDASAFHRKWHDELRVGAGRFRSVARLKRVEHHASHAANAYYTSGFDEALIVTLDGYGSGLAGSISIGRDGAIERVHCLRVSAFARNVLRVGHLGAGIPAEPARREDRRARRLRRSRRSSATCCCRDSIRTTATSGFSRVNNVYFSRLLATRVPEDRRGGSVPARAGARRLRLCRPLRSEDRPQEPGAVGRRRRQREAEPAAEGDAGRRAHLHPPEHGRRRLRHRRGAARVRRQRRGTRCRSRSPTSSSARVYADDEIADALSARSCRSRRYTPIEPKIAALIAAGKVVARFNGRMEYGPRALGNRSILYHAKEPAVNQWLNQRLGRTEFMPFAPATLFEKRHECYRNVDGGEYAAQFMTLTFDCTESMKRDSPAAVHVDGTARPQLVTRDVEPELPQDPHGVSPAHRHPVAHQHQLQHARGADRLLARRRDPGLPAGQPRLPGHRRLPRRAPVGATVRRTGR